MVFKVLVDGSNLGTAIAAMRANCVECLATFPSADVMYMRAIDTANVCICECKTKVVVTGEPEQLGIDLLEMPTDLSGPIELEVADRILIKVGRVTHKIKVLHPGYIRAPPEPKVQWPFVFDLPASELRLGFNEVVKKIPPKDTQGGVFITWRGDELIIEDISRDVVSVSYAPEELHIRVPCDHPVETLLPADYVRPLVSVLGKLDRCIVGLGQTLPVSIGGNNKDLTVGVGYFIAPRSPP